MRTARRKTIGFMKGHEEVRRWSRKVPKLSAKVNVIVAFSRAEIEVGATASATI